VVLAEALKVNKTLQEISSVVHPLPSSSSNSWQIELESTWLRWNSSDRGRFESQHQALADLVSPFPSIENP
jgi:hypothetical protein